MRYITNLLPVIIQIYFRKGLVINFNQDSETIETIAFRETGDAAQRGVELGFVGGARIQADPHDQTVAAEERIPPMDETVTVATVGGEMAGVFHRGQGGCGL